MASKSGTLSLPPLPSYPVTTRSVPNPFRPFNLVGSVSSSVSNPPNAFPASPAPRSGGQFTSSFPDIIANAAPAPASSSVEPPALLPGVTYAVPPFVNPFSGTVHPSFDTQLAAFITALDLRFLQVLLGHLPQQHNQATVDFYVKEYVDVTRPAQFSAWSQAWFQATLSVKPASSAAPTTPVPPPLPPLPSLVANFLPPSPMGSPMLSRSASAPSFPRSPTPQPSQQPVVDPLDPGRALIFSGAHPHPSTPTFEAAALISALNSDKIPNTIKIIRSFCSAARLTIWPPAVGHSVSSYVTALRTVFHVTTPIEELSRYSRFLKLSDKDLLSVLTFNFASVSNPSGFDILSLQRNVEPEFEIQSLLEASCELCAFLTTLYGVPYDLVVVSFLNPLRNLVYASVVSVVSDVVHRHLGFFATVVPLLYPADSHIALWVQTYGIDNNVANVGRLLAYIHTQTVALMAASLRAPQPTDTSGTARGQRLRRDRTPGPLPSSKTNPKMDYGICTGWCLSVFFPKPCPRLAAGKPCVYTNKHKTQVVLKHLPDWHALPAPRKQEMQTFFQDVIAPTLSSKQVAFYS